MPPTLYDRIVQRAKQQGLSVRTHVLRVLAADLETPAATPDDPDTEGGDG